MSSKRKKTFLLQVATVSLGVSATTVACSSGFIGDIAVNPDASADASDARPPDASGNVCINPDCGPPEASTSDVVGLVPFDSGKD